MIIHGIFHHKPAFFGSPPINLTFFKSSTPGDRIVELIRAKDEAMIQEDFHRYDEAPMTGGREIQDLPGLVTYKKRWKSGTM
jgi:hypothetical protein